MTQLTLNHFNQFQHHMCNTLISHDNVFLGSFMGSGKTACALKAFEHEWAHGRAQRALIIAPLAVAKETWPAEIRKWDFCNRLSWSVAVGKEQDRLAAVDTNVHILIMNRENLKWLYELKGADWFKRFDVLIYDEASRLKGNYLTKKKKTKDENDRDVQVEYTTELGWTALVRANIKRCWQLSGTPTSNGVIDLWGPMYVLDGGQRLSRTFDAYKSRFFGKDRAGRPYPTEGSIPLIMHYLSDIMFCLRQKDYIDLPPLKVIDRFVELDEQTKKYYRQMKNDLAIEELNAEAFNNAVAINKLLQLCNGSIYAPEDELFEEMNPDPMTAPASVAKFVHDRKVLELESIVKETWGRNLLVAYSYQFDALAIKKKFRHARIFGETDHDLSDWNAGKISMLLVHPMSAAHGLNFQHGGNIAVWFGLSWSLELYQQFNARLHRRGQEADTVFLYRILANIEADKKVAKALEDKAEEQVEVVERTKVTPADIEWSAVV